MQPGTLNPKPQTLNPTPKPEPSGARNSIAAQYLVGCVDGRNGLNEEGDEEGCREGVGIEVVPKEELMVFGPLDGCFGIVRPPVSL